MGGNGSGQRWERNAHGEAQAVVKLYTASVTTWMTPEMLEELTVYAKKHRCSRPEVIRTFIEWGLEVE